eukprot:scaffold62224_cov65-Phaeocystis_antarctica.AAC.6
MPAAAQRASIDARDDDRLARPVAGEVAIGLLGDRVQVRRTRGGPSADVPLHRADVVELRHPLARVERGEHVARGRVRQCEPVAGEEVGEEGRLAQAFKQSGRDASLVVILILYEHRAFGVDTADKMDRKVGIAPRLIVAHPPAGAIRQRALHHARRHLAAASAFSKLVQKGAAKHENSLQRV